MVLDNIIDENSPIQRPLDLLNENITVEAAFQLKQTAKDAVAFLQQEKVLLKTLEPNFCHAKAFIYSPKGGTEAYYVTGSSNLTETGMGLRETSTLELNAAGKDSDANYEELKNWFANLWDSRQARLKKTINGEKVNFKEYLIEQIKRIFVEYTPRDLYYKTLFEMFGRKLLEFQNDPTLSRNIGRLEHSEIYKCLYEFQRKGVLSLIKMLESHNGAILADAVGLGKTWSALAVMKYYQSQGYDIILLCP
jgi:SNF2 family DNA or RNA helicase